MAKRSRRIIFGITLLLGLATALVAFENLRGKRAVRAYKAKLLAKGEKLRIEELIAPFSAEANQAANRLVQTAWQLSPRGPVLPMIQPVPLIQTPAMRFVAPGRALVGWAQPDIRNSGRPANRWEELAAQLDDHRDALTQIREELKNSPLDWNLNYHQGFNLRLPHLARMKQIAQWFSAATLNDLHVGDLNQASADLQALLALANGFRDERTIVSQLVRISIAAIAFGATWEALQADGWTDAQLAELQKGWESLEFIRPVEKSLEMGRATGLLMFERFRCSDTELRQMLGGAGGGPAGNTSALSPPANVEDVPEFVGTLFNTTLSAAASFGRENLWRWLWSHRDELQFLQAYQVMLDRIRQLDADGHLVGSYSREGNDGVLFDWEFALKQRYFMSAALLPAGSRCFGKVCLTETHRALVVTAIALKRYQLRHGKPAQSLAALAPEFLARSPRDFMDGKELRYRFNPDGTFVLYSIGEDGKDDGGDPRLASNRSYSRYFADGRDMVWPMPATREDMEEEETRSASGDYYSRQMLERYGLKPNGK